MGRVVGIDLGTTNSVVAIVENGKPKVIPSPQGDPVVPSIIAKDTKGNKLVGQNAKRQMVMNPGSTVIGAKRLMGRHFSSSIVKKTKMKFFYDIVEGPRQEVAIKVGEEVLDLTDISAQILEELKDLAQDYLEERADKAVITVPAYFNEKQRESVRLAGEKAGFDVLRIINEPTAAALSFGWGKKINEKILVYDLGGGTFDISVLELFEHVYEVRAIGGDSFLGGMDFDQRIAEFLVQDFKTKEGIDLSEDPVALQRLRDAAERAKKDLSTLEEVQISLPFLTMRDGQPVNLLSTLTKKQLNNLTKDLILQTFEICDKTLEEVELSIKDISEIIFVGGQTRMPLVRELAEEHFQKKLNRSIHPDEVVALGAAILADSLEQGDSPIIFVDVLPVSIGIGLAKGKFKRLINKNTKVPISVKKVFRTSKDNQKAVKVKVYQGESSKVAENEYIGEFIFTDITQAKAGEVKIEINFTLDDESILHVSAKDLISGKEVTTYFKTDTIVKKETYRSDLLLGDKGKKIDNIKNKNENILEHPEEKKETVPKKPEEIKSEKQEAKKDIKPVEKKNFWQKILGFFSKKT